jgi:hypothetical protein
MLGMYVLLADDTVPGYGSDNVWQPALVDSVVKGSNTVFFTFINPTHMRVPPAFSALAKTRGNGQNGSIASGTTILFSIGGESYSTSPNPWPFLASASAAKAMAAEVAKWPALHGCDGIDFDLETGAGDAAGAGENAVIFFTELRRLNPSVVITQPVFGYPQVGEENYVVNHGWTKSGTWLGGPNKIGIMVYSGTNSLQWVKNYANATSQWQGFPIQVNVPSHSILVGIGGDGTTEDVLALAQATLSENLGGIMVWFASALNNATGKPAIQYGTYGDASYSVGSGWAQALALMQ